MHSLTRWNTWTTVRGLAIKFHVKTVNDEKQITNCVVSIRVLPPSEYTKTGKIWRDWHHPLKMKRYKSLI